MNERNPRLIRQRVMPSELDSMNHSGYFMKAPDLQIEGFCRSSAIARTGRPSRVSTAKSDENCAGPPGF
jgi:hypothetical protein